MKIECRTKDFNLFYAETKDSYHILNVKSHSIINFTANKQPMLS